MEFGCQTFIVNFYSMYVIDFPAFKAAMLNKKIALFWNSKTQLVYSFVACAQTL